MLLISRHNKPLIAPHYASCYGHIGWLCQIGHVSCRWLRHWPAITIRPLHWLRQSRCHTLPQYLMSLLHIFAIIRRLSYDAAGAFAGFFWYNIFAITLIQRFHCCYVNTLHWCYATCCHYCHYTVDIESQDITHTLLPQPLLIAVIAFITAFFAMPTPLMPWYAAFRHTRCWLGCSFLSPHTYAITMSLLAYYAAEIIFSWLRIDTQLFSLDYAIAIGQYWLILFSFLDIDGHCLPPPLILLTMAAIDIAIADNIAINTLMIILPYNSYFRLLASFLGH